VYTELEGVQVAVSDIRLYTDFELQKMFEELPEFRKVKAGRYKYTKDRDLKTLAFHMLCQLLNTTPLSFKVNQHGKPSLVEEDLAHSSFTHFSLSTSGTKAMVAVSHTAPVGADIEQVRAVEDGVIECACSDQEMDALAAVEDSVQRRRAFFELWTSKEAYSKALGTGLSPDIRGIPSDRALTLLEDGYCLAVAVAG
jgi:4'-phosphopantetheinyl transferase